MSATRDVGDVTVPTACVAWFVPQRGGAARAALPCALPALPALAPLAARQLAVSRSDHRTNQIPTINYK